MKMEILVNVTIHKSQIGQSFLLTPADGTYDPVFGIGWGLRYAVSDFVGMFNQAGVMDDEGNVIQISRENVKLQDRPYLVCYVQ